MEMDMLKMNLSTKFMKGIVAKLIAKALVKKFGYQIDVQINKIEIEAIDGKILLHADLDAETDNKEFVKIIKDIGLD